MSDEFKLLRSKENFMEGAVDFSRFAGCFGTSKMYGTDLDLYVDLAGVGLMVEFKRCGAKLPKGQRLTLVHHSMQALVSWDPKAGSSVVSRGPNWSMAVWETDHQPSLVRVWRNGKACNLTDEDCKCGLCDRIAQIVGERRVTVRTEEDLKRVFCQFAKYAKWARS